MTPLRLRPHHGLCLQHFVGKGYNQPFADNMARVVRLLAQNPRQEIELCADSVDDVLCNYCPRNIDDVCAAEVKASRFDTACLQICGFAIGQRLPWEDFRRALRRDIIDAGRLGEVCAGCEWLAVCQAAYT